MKYAFADVHIAGSAYAALFAAPDEGGLFFLIATPRSEQDRRADKQPLKKRISVSKVQELVFSNSHPGNG